jgi:hypothetical protein
MELNYFQSAARDSKQEYFDGPGLQVLVRQQAEIQKRIQEVERQEAVLREQLLQLRAIERLED